jgi:uncharacterized tellurite resistance protein B-like protein
MHIIFGLLAVLGGLAFWWWRLKMISEATSEISDVAGRAWGKYKRNKFRKKVEDAPVESVEDPAVAAVVMMYAVAKDVGPITEKVENAIYREVSEVMKIADAAEIIVFGKWVASHVTDPSNLTLRYAKLWNSALSRDERLEFVEILERVIAKAGSKDVAMNSKLNKLRERLGLLN